MTCNNCKESVEIYLGELDHITEVSVNLEKGEAEVTMSNHVAMDCLLYTSDAADDSVYV